MGSHINAEGEFQSDKYPLCPPGKVPLNTKDPSAQPLLLAYAQTRRGLDEEFSADVEEALRLKGYSGEPAKFAKDMLGVAMDAYLRWQPDGDAETFLSWVKDEACTPKPYVGPGTFNAVVPTKE